MHAAADTSILDAVREMARSLAGESLSIGAASAEYALDRVPEIRRAKVEETVVRAGQATVAVLFDRLASGAPTASFAPPTELLQSLRAVVQFGVPLRAVLHSLRMSGRYVVEYWLDSIAHRRPRDPRALDIAKAGAAGLMESLDSLIERLTDEYREEEERLGHQRSLARLEEVRRVLTDERVDAETAGARLGYRLTGGHIAVVIRGSDESRLTGSGFDPSRIVGGSGAGLTVRADLRTVWYWLPTEGSRPEFSLSDDSMLIGVGRPGTGTAGFRRSHREALDALRVAELRCPDGSAVIHYDDVGVAALCTSDPDACRTFVQTELGALATDDPAVRRQRQTLAAFLAAHCNYRATAAVLGVHHNTVRYRMDQIERALGRDIEKRRLAIELALHLADAIGYGNERPAA